MRFLQRRLAPKRRHAERSGFRLQEGNSSGYNTPASLQCAKKGISEGSDASWVLSGNRAAEDPRLALNVPHPGDVDSTFLAFLAMFLLDSA